jgi:NPCBM-associated, NEW3 domain of alpha-galactosidase
MAEAPDRMRPCGPPWCRRRGFGVLGKLLFLVWLGALVRSLVRLCRAANRDRGRPHEGNIPAWAYRQPDPMIYSQQYLQSLGLAVTWDNPDIQVELPGAPGVPVDSHALLPDTDYVVASRIWNGATTAPAPGLPVKVSYLEFGIGTTRHDVGMTKVDLPAKGAAGCPATACVGWRTPPTPGHYCLQVELVWDDDAQPANNLGQRNTDVKALNSPHAAFTFPVRNDRPERRLITIELDGYAIPPLDPCGDERHGRGGRLARHERWAWPVPEGWRVTADPGELALAAGESAEVTVDVTAPDGFAGRQPINVHAVSDPYLLGGVTLYVEGSG